jgi:hypothetical protein
MKLEYSFLGMEGTNDHQREAENRQLQVELDAFAQETFNSLDWDLMDPIFGF